MTALFFATSLLKVVLALALTLGLARLAAIGRPHEALGCPTPAGLLPAGLALLMVAVVPFGEPLEVAGASLALLVADLPWALLFVMVLLFLGTFATPGEPRAVGCRLAMILALATVLVLSGKTDASGIVEDQRSWWHLFKLPAGPLAFLLFWAAALAESPLRSEANGPRPASGAPITWAAYSLLTSALFLGGHTLFGLERASGIVALDAVLGLLFLLGKAFALLWGVLWLGRVLPELGQERLAAHGWKFLPPLALLVLLLGGGGVLLRIH